MKSNTKTCAMAVKRAIDILAASLLLTLAWPLMALIALLVFRWLGRPILFVQTRPGLDGKPFNMLKLRTMINQRDADGRLLPDQDRLTRWGRFLRRWSLDELPQLWNVLRGDMSLVGPRPLLMEYLDRYTSEQSRRHEVRPGITGWAQVRGRNAIGWEEKFQLDVWYVDHACLALDLKILMLTVINVLRGDGVSAASHATMRPFEGSQPEKRKYA